MKRQLLSIINKIIILPYHIYDRLSFLISLIIVLFVAISLNSILATSLSINKVKFNNNLSSLCTISIITCLDNISSIQKEDSDVKKQTELILEQVNSTKLKEWINNLSSFHTRHTKSNHIENVAYWIKNELETLCENRVFFQNFTQRDDNQTFQLKNYHL
jgi:copper chaperone CopZ